jgi:hypothetical protein
MYSSLFRDPRAAACTLTDFFGLYWTILDYFGLLWTTLDYIESLWTILDNANSRDRAKVYGFGSHHRGLSFIETWWSIFNI